MLSPLALSRRTDFGGHQPLGSGAGCRGELNLKLWRTPHGASRLRPTSGLVKARAVWLTHGVQVYTRYKTMKRRRSLSGFLSGVLALGGIAFLGWVFARYATDVNLPPAAPGGRRTNVAPAPRGAPPPTNAQPRFPGVALSPTNLVLKTNLQPVSVLPTAALVPDTNPRPVRSILEAQIALARRGVSSGSIDGVLGAQTRSALRAFQRQEGLPVTGLLDPATCARLNLTPPLFESYAVTMEDVARLGPVSPTWLGKSRQERLDFENLLELVAEKRQSHPALIHALNPGADWAQPSAGLVLNVPCIPPPNATNPAARIHIGLAARTLEAYDAWGGLLLHFPCSIAQQVDKRPRGWLRVVVIIRNPDYTFNPAVFPESAEGRRLGRKLLIRPGPNNPVGVAWIGLDRPGYGIHGTPRPEEVGRTESHGCFRLANWNADHLAQIVSLGTPVEVEP